MLSLAAKGSCMRAIQMNVHAQSTREICRLNQRASLMLGHACQSVLISRKPLLPALQMLLNHLNNAAICSAMHIINHEPHGVPQEVTP